MKRFKKALALTLVLAIAATTMGITALADNDDEREGEAGIDFTEGETVIPPDPDPDPDPDLPGVKNRNIYFGEQELNGATMKYDSVTTHDDTARQHAGFMVSSGNHRGWSVTVQISGFALDNDVDTMENFRLKLSPGAIHKLPENTGIEPTAHEVTLAGSNDKGVLGTSIPIFTAKAGEGFGKFGCNWQGELTVIGGSVADEGSATATMLWALGPALQE